MSSIDRCHGGYCFDGSKAVDAIYKPGADENELSNLASTLSEPNPWIQIDLGQAYSIVAVKVWNRIVPDLPGILVIKTCNTLFDNYYNFVWNRRVFNLPGILTTKTFII